MAIKGKTQAIAAKHLFVIVFLVGETQIIKKIIELVYDKQVGWQKHFHLAN